MLTPAPGAVADRLIKGQTADPQSGRSGRGSHEYGAASACKRLWTLSYAHRLRVVDDRPYRKRGTLFHTHAAYHYASQLAFPPDWFRSIPLEEALVRDSTSADERTKIAAAWNAYRLKYSSDPIRPVAVEHEFSCRIVDIAPSSLMHDPLMKKHGDEPVTCRTDVLGEINGEFWAIDHKTTSVTTRKDGMLPAWSDLGEYRLNLQVLVNLHVIRFVLEKLDPGRQLRGFMVNRVKIAAPYDFDRNLVRVSVLTYEEAALSLLDAAEQRARTIERIEQGLPVPPNYAACFGRYGACDMADICAASSEAARGEMMQYLLQEH